MAGVVAWQPPYGSDSSIIDGGVVALIEFVIT